MQYTETNILLCLDKANFGYKNKDTNEMVTILKDVSFTLKDIEREGFGATGQIAAFVGRSGRGKSTLFKGLTGLLKPMSGQVLITDLSTETPDDAKVIEEGDVGFVDQKYTLFRHKTVTKILEYALRKYKGTPAEKNEIIKTHLTEWGLYEHRNKYSCELSGGQRQRTAILEQLLTSKHFMVFDEPASGLDVGNIEKLKASFNKILSTDTLNTIIFSTHDIHLAVELADSIHVIGHPEGVEDYSTIVKSYDLKQMGLAWTEYGAAHRELGNEIKELLIKS